MSNEQESLHTDSNLSEIVGYVDCPIHVIGKGTVVHSMPVDAHGFPVSHAYEWAKLELGVTTPPPKTRIISAVFAAIRNSSR